MRILVIEDNTELTRQIKSTLEHALYAVDVALDGEEGQFLGETEPYDAVILDLGLPKLDGLTVLQRWRASGNKVPVLILTSRQTWREKLSDDLPRQSDGSIALKAKAWAVKAVSV